jgi:hypothetical protein
MSSTDNSEVTSAAPIDFYDLAAKFVEETSTSDQPHRLLKLWARRFPEYASDLAALAYARLAEPKVASEEASQLDEDAVVQSARRILSKFGQTRRPITSIIAAANLKGINPHSLAARLRIDIPILAKLEQRLLDISSIPGVLIDKLAGEIGQARADIVYYLSSTPRLANDADYRADQPPSLQNYKPQSFEDALSASKMISPDNRKYWQEQIDLERHIS